jgi:hypothetical protein
MPCSGGREEGVVLLQGEGCDVEGPSLAPTLRPVLRKERNHTSDNNQWRGADQDGERSWSSGREA